LPEAYARTSIQTGQVRVTPKAGHAVPDGVLMFSYKPDGVTVTETSIPAVQPGSVFLAYAEATAAVHSGIALANSGTSEAAVTLSLKGIAGEALDFTATLTLRPNGHTAVFLREIPGFESLPSDLRGVLQVMADGPSPITVVALRSRYNERGDFLVSTMQVIEARAMPSPQLIFPHLADGGGYTTEFVFFNASAVQTTVTFDSNTPAGEPLPLQLR
jgi:hypothetical protein